MKSLGKKEDMTLNAVPEKAKIRYPSFSISSKVMPEIEDYSMNETIEMNIVCKVSGLRKGWDDKNEVVADLDMTKAEITNVKEDRKEAKRRGLDMKDYADIKKKQAKIVEENA